MRNGVLLVAAIPWGACDPPTALGRVPIGDDAPALAADPPTAPLRCGALSRSEEVKDDPSVSLVFAREDDRLIARGGPWSRGSTNRTGALVAPDAECGVRALEREEDAAIVAVRDRGCVAGLRGASAVQLFFNQNVSGLCALRDDGSLQAGQFDVARAALTSHMTMRAEYARCGRGDWWEAAITRDPEGQRHIQFLDDNFRPNGPPYGLPVEAGEPRPVALVNNTSRWDGLWSVEREGGLLHERYRPIGELALGASYPSRLDGLTRETSQRWSASQVGAERVQVLDAFDRGGGLFALAQLESARENWVGGLFFCSGAGVRARRLYDGPVIDAMLVGLGTDQVLITLHRDGAHQVLSATRLSSDFSVRSNPRELLRAPGLTLLGADVGPRVGRFLVWHARPFGERSELRVSSFALTR